MPCVLKDIMRRSDIKSKEVAIFINIYWANPKDAEKLSGTINIQIHIQKRTNFEKEHDTRFIYHAFGLKVLFWHLSILNPHYFPLSSIWTVCPLMKSISRALKDGWLVGVEVNTLVAHLYQTSLRYN